jgi:hypothetical protein
MFKIRIPAFAGMILFPSTLHACAVCFGGADGNLIRGFTWGVALLGLLPFLLITGLVTLVVRSSKKANHHE